MANKRKEIVAALAKLKIMKRRRCFDPYDLDSTPTSSQQEVIDDFGKVPHMYVIGGNQSGKSQLGGRIVSWVLTGTHPTWTPPAEWEGIPIQIIVIGRVSKQVDDELWEKKIKPFLEPGSYTAHKSGGILNKVVHNPTGNHILFFSHNAPEEARAKVQSFTANMVWLDEMPNSIGLVEELHRRVMSRRGFFLATFTPKLKNEQIRRLIDTPSGFHKKYKLRMLDNPLFDGRHEEILAPMATLPEGYRKTLLEGNWYVGDNAVYHFDPQMHVENPPGYHPGWRHVEAVDPAAASKAGLILLAECPTNGIWYIVRADYILGHAATVLLDKLRPITDSLNIARRVCDTNATWFIKEAAIQGRHYRWVENKAERKKILIKNLQEALYENKLKVAPWCNLLVDEFVSCQWSETTSDRIVGSQRFHLLDALQYGLDLLPRGEVVSLQLTHDQWLQKAHRERVIKESKRRKGRIRRRRHFG